MTFIRPKPIYTVAKKEFIDNIRNKWIIILTMLFVILIIAFSYVAGGQTGDDTFGNMQNTVFGLLGISSLLIPLIAIILGFSTISGEAETGSLYVVLSYPIKRIEVLIGKLLGLGAVISLSVLLGFGFGGIIIAITVGTESFQGYLAFILLSIFIGLIYLSLSICISSYCKRRITSIGGGIVIFFWSIIYGTVIIAVFLGAGYEFSDFMRGNIPDWFFNSVILSPSDMYQTTVQRAFDVKTIETAGFSVSIPEFLSLPVLLIAQFIWFIIPLVIAYFLFKRRDI